MQFAMESCLVSGHLTGRVSYGKLMIATKLRLLRKRIESEFGKHSRFSKATT